MGKMPKQALINALKVFIALGLIYWLVTAGILDFESFKKVMHPTPIIAGLLLEIFAIFSNNWRWLILLRARGINSTHRETMSLSLIGIFFNFAVPGGVGGDLVKGFYIVKDYPEKKLDAALTVLVDRIVGLFSMLTLALFGSLFIWSTMSRSSALMTTMGFILLMWLGISVFFALALHPRIGKSAMIPNLLQKLPGGEIFKKLFSAICAYSDHKKELGWAFLLSALGQQAHIFIGVMVGYYLGLDLSIWFYICLVPIGIVSSILAIVPAGIGVGQAAFYFLFKFHSEEAGQIGAIIATALQIFLFAWGLIGAVLYLQRKKPKQLEEVSL